MTLDGWRLETATYGISQKTQTALYAVAQVHWTVCMWAAPHLRLESEMWDGESIQMWLYRDFAWAKVAICGTSQSHCMRPKAPLRVRFVTPMEQWNVIHKSFFSHTDNLLRGHALERCQTGREYLQLGLLGGNDLILRELAVSV
eukprot:COSAG01_NODE_394_length_17660_cov_5.141954_11_plen_144_part_00